MKNLIKLLPALLFTTNLVAAPVNLVDCREPTFAYGKVDFKKTGEYIKFKIKISNWLIHSL